MNIPKYRLEKLSHDWFQLQREEMAAALAGGDYLAPYGKPLLDFDDLANRLFDTRADEINTALRLCTTNPELGGRHIKRILDEIAQQLVDSYEQTFRASYENELNRSEAA